MASTSIGSPKRRPGPVGLEVVDVGRLDAGRRQRPAQHGLLGQPVGDGEAAARAVLVHCRAPDDSEDRITGRDGVAQTLQHDDAAALASHEPVRRGVEGLAPPVGGHHPPVVEADERLRQHDEVHAAGQGHRRLTEPQALAGLVYGHQRGRAGCVDGHAGALEPQRVRDAAGRGVERSAGGRVHVELRRPSELGELDVVVRRDADEDAGEAALQRIGGDSGALQGLPAGLEHQPLLWIHRGRLARRDPEEPRIELVDLVDEAPIPGGVAGQRVEVDARGLGERSPLRWVLPHDVAPVPQQVPVRLRRIGSTGEPAAHSDDRDRLAPGGFDGVELGLHLVERLQRALEQCTPVGRFGVRHQILVLRFRRPTAASPGAR